MDWRHQSEMLQAGDEAYSKLLTLCIWNKNNGGMGSLYRSKHELVYVFSRAEKSLALIAYSDNPNAVYNHVINEGWFEKDEIEVIS